MEGPGDLCTDWLSTGPGAGFSKCVLGDFLFIYLNWTNLDQYKFIPKTSDK